MDSYPVERAAGGRKNRNQSFVERYGRDVSKGEVKKIVSPPRKTDFVEKAADMERALDF